MVGAGPAGLSAAYLLAREGFQVEVFERSHTVGHRFHGDFQGLENWSSDQDVIEELEEWGLPASRLYLTPVRTTTFLGPDGSRAEAVCRGRPFYYLVRRGPMEESLDRRLLALAQQAGVTVHFGRAIRDIPFLPAIVATGPRRPNALALGYVFKTDGELRSYGVMSEELAPGGYAYLLTYGGSGTLATVLARHHEQGRDYLRRTVDFFRAQVEFPMEEEQFFGGVGNISPPRTAVRGRRLFVGEAAGFQDALWGFGLRFAMLSGLLAARALISGEDYDRLWRERLTHPLMVGVANRLLWEMLGERAYHLVIRRLRQEPDPIRLLRREMRFTLLKRLALLVAPIYYRRRVRVLRQECDLDACTNLFCTMGADPRRAVCMACGDCCGLDRQTGHA